MKPLFLFSLVFLLSCGRRDAVRVAVSVLDAAHCYTAHASIPPESLAALPFYERETAGLLYLTDGKNEHLLIAEDAVSPHFEAVRQIKAALADSLSIPASRVVVHANHNHQSRRFDVQKFIDVLLPAVRSLRQAAVPVEISHVRAGAKGLLYNRRVFISDELGSLSLGHQFHAINDTAAGVSDVTEQVRDYFSGVKLDKENYDFKGVAKDGNLKSGKIRMFLKEMEGRKFFADGPVDDRLDWLIFRERGKKAVLGSLVRFSAHRNTCPQFLTRALSGATDGAPCFFMIGTAGSCGILEFSDGGPYSEERRLAAMEAAAAKMAQRLTAAREKAAFKPVGKIAWQQENAPLEVARDIRNLRPRLKDLEAEWGDEYEKVRASQCTPAAYKAARDKAGRGWAIANCGNYPDTLLAPFTVMRLDSLAFLFLPGEILEPIGDTLRARSGEKDLLIMGLCDDSRLAYVPHPDEVSLGGYEVINSRLSPAGLNALMDAGANMLKFNKNAE